MNYNLDEFVDRNNTNCTKWEFMKRLDPYANKDTIPLWIADMDFPCAEPIIEALHKRIDRKIFGYSNNNTPEYYNAVCTWYHKHFDLEVDSSDIFFSPGVVPAIGYLIEILTKKGEGVIIQNPVYYPFKRQIDNRERTLINSPLINNNGYYEMDFEDLEEKAKNPNNKLMILCSPHNPVGRVWKEEELKKAADICIKHGVKIISDEIHYDLVRKWIKHTPLEKVVPEYKNEIFTATAPSKTFNLAGMQLSNIIIHDKEVQEKWKKYVVDVLNVHGPNALAITAAEAAYEKGEEWLEQVKGYIDSNVVFIENYLKEHLPKAVYVKPEGTYLVWINLRAYGYSQEELMEIMFKKANILVEAGDMFGEEGIGFIRVNVACTREILTKALERMAKALN